ncbi:Centromere protein I [Neolecta irregularis DAH-3]|uniref:Centromere protein I n=1 Tax=Neolecta irregularis (strain DAH-3) TaxID=1198029 RepID=A0A1U7LT27_NEOID|nr:Centromere protein I [Neolecta irregularis DAH-3]|eukprot:OLL25768.1 Centromere protein I [Neolecta irregularis DAH-3]
MSLDNELDNALHQLVLCAAAPLQNPAQLHSTIDQIAAVALDRGVSLVFLSAVIAILTDSHSFDPASVARILALLLPRSAVAPRVLPALLKYAVMVYPLIEDHAQADLCYNILFHFLDYVTLRTHICHLLHLMTRRHHVKLHRIRKLQELQEFAVLDRPLNALFALYKEYYPDLILLRISRSKSTIFTHPDPEWLKRAQAIIQRESRTLSSDYTIQLNPTHPKEFKVPLATTFRATPQSITVKDIRSVADFVKYIDLVELPSQLVSILQNKLVQQIILHRESDKRDAMVRLKHWIQSFLYDEIVDKYEVEDFLIKLNNTCEIFGELLPGVQEWLYSFASSWTGEIFVEQIFGLVRFILPMDLHAFKKKVLEPFDTLFIKLAPHSQILCLKSFGRLVYQWSLRIQNGDQPLLSSFPPDTQLEKPSGIRDILSETVNHVDRWAVYALQKYPYNLVLHDAICKFYENLVVLYIEHPTLEI